MKHAGQKSVKEELPEQRKGPKRAVECRLKVQTHVWEHIPPIHEDKSPTPQPAGTLPEAGTSSAKPLVKKRP